MKLSQNGLELIKSFEGCRLKAYKCLPSEKYYTIGYGHYGSDVKADMCITEIEAEELLKKDVEKAVKHVNSFMAKYNFNQNQFDALVSFTHNVGSINQLTQNSTRTLAQISEALLLYCKCGGNTIKGLVTRRKKEKKLFDSGNEKKTEIEIALEIIDGKWGNGTNRKTKIESNGYNYNNIQKLVNVVVKWMKEKGYN